MDKYAINQESVNTLNCLANDLLISANNMVEANHYLEKSILCLYEQLDLYGDEVISIVIKNKSTLNASRKKLYIWHKR